MSEIEDAVEEFLDGAETVYDEYDQGYIDADVALRRLRVDVDALETALDVADE